MKIFVGLEKGFWIGTKGEKSSKIDFAFNPGTKSPFVTVRY
jgi:hypothetical protein